MSEIEREDILAQRQEEMQRIQDKRNLDAMLRDRSGAGDENISKAAKREPYFTLHLVASYLCLLGHHAQRGATKEKSKKLDELKAKRKAKDEKKRVTELCLSWRISCTQCYRQGRIPLNATGRRPLWTWKPRTTKKKTARSASSMNTTIGIVEHPISMTSLPNYPSCREFVFLVTLSSSNT